MADPINQERSLFSILIVPLLLLISLPLLMFSSCKQEESQEFRLELPSTPVLTSRSSYALITSSHLRLRSGPGLDYPVRETLWKGAVMEVIRMVPTKDLVDNMEGFWYQINYDGLEGYVFGSYLQFFNTRQEAVEASRSPNF